MNITGAPRKAVLARKCAHATKEDSLPLRHTVVLSTKTNLPKSHTAKHTGNSHDPLLNFLLVFSTKKGSDREPHTNGGTLRGTIANNRHQLIKQAQ